MVWVVAGFSIAVERLKIVDTRRGSGGFTRAGLEEDAGLAGAVSGGVEGEAALDLARSLRCGGRSLPFAFAEVDASVGEQADDVDLLPAIPVIADFVAANHGLAV